MNSHLKKKLNEVLKPARQKLDPQALEILEDLVKRLDINRIMPMERDDVHDVSGVGFKGKNTGVVVTVFPKAMEHIAAEIESVKKEQFATFADTVRFCHGTNGLMELLMRYTHVVTEKAVITAVPDANTYRNGRAVFEKEDLDDPFDDGKRLVMVNVIYDGGFAAFTFEENVKHKAS